MTQETIIILLIEDDESFVALVEKWLSELPTPNNINIAEQFYLYKAHNLATAFSYLEQRSIDIILTELNLSDSHGLATCGQILNRICRVPIIILSELNDENLSIQALSMGVQDYLIKSFLDARQLWRAIHYSIERIRLQCELEQIRQIQLQNLEKETLERINQRNSASLATAQAFGLSPIEYSQPELFATWIDYLTRIWEHDIEMRTHRVVYNISQELKELAWEIGRYKCGPRDVVALYRATLKRLERPDKPRRNEIVHEEGLYLAFELMGNLVSYYRPYSLGILSHPSTLRILNNPEENFGFYPGANIKDQL